MTETFQIQSEEELDEVCQQIEQLSKTHKIFTLKGEMGTGKTSLVKRYMERKGISEVSSPTFAIVNRYENDAEVFYHFDLYRIEHVDELHDIGFEEYLDSGHVCFIEWPEKAAELIPTQQILVTIQDTGVERIIEITPPIA